MKLKLTFPPFTDYDNQIFDSDLIHFLNEEKDSAVVFYDYDCKCPIQVILKDGKVYLACDEQIQIGEILES